jgi:protein-tyrosine-phosphatase
MSRPPRTSRCSHRRRSRPTSEALREAFDAIITAKRLAGRLAVAAHEERNLVDEQHREQYDRHVEELSEIEDIDPWYFDQAFEEAAGIRDLAAMTLYALEHEGSDA